MWRTGTTLLLVSLAFASAIQNEDQVHVAGLSIKDKGPIRFVRANVDDVHVGGLAAKSQVQTNEEPLIAMAPVKEEKTKKGPSFMETFRYMRSNAVPQALNAVGLGHGNQFADAQKTISIPITGKTIPVTIGSKPAINVQFSLEDDVFFVYDSTQCDKTKCKKTEVKQTFDTTGATLTQKPGEFSYKNGAAKGDHSYQDKIGLDKDTTPAIQFGVATGGDNKQDVVDGDGYLGLGFSAAAGPAYGSIQSILGALAPSRALTIFKKKDLSGGTIYLGDVKYKECPGKATELQDALMDKNKVQQWWFKAAKVEVGDKSNDSVIVKVQPEYDGIGLPNALVNKIMDAMKDLAKDSKPDISKFPKVTLTVGKDVIQLDGSAYATKQGDKYDVNLRATGNEEVQVILGNPALSQLCVTLQQADDKATAFKIGLHYSVSFAGSATLSVLSLVVLPLVYFMGL